jgi:large subunit ribosomal protein L17
MRHQKKTIKLGRTAEHRKALLANQVCSLIEHERIKTTLAKAKAVRPLAERMVTLGKNGSLHARRTALAVLRQKNAVKKLFDNIAPRSSERMGGYTRIVKLGMRKSDSAPVAFLEWVDAAPATEEKEEPKKKGKEKAPKTEKTEEAVEREPVTKSETQKPAAVKQETAPAAEEKTTPTKAPAETASEEPKKAKKRKWFGRKSGEDK